MNDPLPLACKGGSAAVITMGFSSVKAKKIIAKQGTYALATNPGRWSNATLRPIWWSKGAVLRLTLEKKEISSYHGDMLR